MSEQKTGRALERKALEQTIGQPDHDGADTGWAVSPGDYAKTRAADFAVPALPASCHVTMRDGCRIAVDVYVPAGSADSGARFPAITIFTPYNRRFKLKEAGVEPTPNAAKYRDFFVPRGYAVVVIDVRGTGASFGTRTALRAPQEREDSYEIADWIVAQAWSTGVIGSTGISYLGAAACFLASTGHKAVKAIAPLFSVADIYNEQLFPGGMLSRVWSRDYDELMIALDQNDPVRTARFPYFNDPRLDGPQPVDGDSDGALLAAAMDEHKNNFHLHDMMPELAFRDEGTLHDPSLTTDACSPFYYQLDSTPKNVPIYSISGWYDGGGYANGSISRFLTMAGPDDRLLLGPWDHGARTNVSPWRTQPGSQFPILAEVLRFFDEHLLGLDTGIRNEAAIHYYNIHANQWRESNVWPPVPAARVYPTADGGIAAQPAHGTATVPYQVRFDTTTGSETRWERLGAANVENYFLDWNGRDEAMLNFTSGPLEADTELSGHIVVNLNLSSSQPDAALFVYAAEVDADGKAHYMTEGMLRALHRATAASPEEYRTTWPYRTFYRTDARRLEPGVAERMEFALLPISWVLKKGSRLRISIAGADADHFPQIPQGRPPLLKFVVGGEQASHIDIPWRPA